MDISYVFSPMQKTFNIKTPQVEIYAIETYNKYPIKYLWGGFITAERLKNLMCDKLDDLDTLHAHWTYEYAYAASFYEKNYLYFVPYEIMLLTYGKSNLGKIKYHAYLNR